MIRIMYNGLGGQVGNAIQTALRKNDTFLGLGLSINEADLMEPESMRTLFIKHKPQYFIHAAAYTAVDKAEEDRAVCHQINVKATETIAELCLQYDCRLIYLSSDYVYHSIEGKPISEEDSNTPKGYYAQTKWEGELAIQGILTDYYIFRTSWVYDPFGHNFVNSMLRLGATRDRLNIVDDQKGAPTYAPDIAQAILQVVQQNAFENKDAYGVYNLTNQGVTDWADYARCIFELEGVNCSVKGISTETYAAPAPRPKWSVLDGTKLKETFQIQLPHWEESLKRCLNARKNRSKIPEGV